eukprot:9549738-Karenia_brevis.AAC.1
MEEREIHRADAEAWLIRQRMVAVVQKHPKIVVDRSVRDTGARHPTNEEQLNALGHEVIQE